MLASFGGGFGPAAQSLSLELYNSRARALGEIGEGEVAESGRLFGATSVIQVVASQIVGPTLFGLTYVHTVSFFPGAIFFVSAASICIALIFFSFIRLPKAGLVAPLVIDSDSDLERDAGVLITVDTVTDAVAPPHHDVEREETLVEVDETSPLLRSRKSSPEGGKLVDVSA